MMYQKWTIIFPASVQIEGWTGGSVEIRTSDQFINWYRKMEAPLLELHCSFLKTIEDDIKRKDLRCITFLPVLFITQPDT